MIVIINQYLDAKEIIVDRVNDNYIVVEVEKGKIKILKDDYIFSIKEGDILKIDKNGKFVVDRKKTKKRARKIKKLVDELFIN